jgi:proline iminopeptidase
MVNEKQGYIKVPGGKVWYQIAGNKKGIPLIVVHGGPGFPHYSLRPLDNLCNERQIVFYDQLGCGKSDRPRDISLWKKERFVKELQEVIAFLKLEKYHILGNSWGSMLATEYALTKPSGLISLILSGPFLSVPRWINDANALRKKLPEAIQDILSKHELSGTTNSKEYEKAALEFYKRHLCRIYPFPKLMRKASKEAGVDVYDTMWGPSEFYCTGNLKGHDLTSRLCEIKIPVLLTCGKYDEATPKTVKYYESLFPNAQMVVFKNSAHMAILEETEIYVKTVRKFLSKITRCGIINK